MLIDYIRQVHASKKITFSNSFKFVEFDDITNEGITEADIKPDTLEIWAAIDVPFKGEVPESYKILNLMIGDWVAQNEDTLTKVIHKKLVEYFEEKYPDSDLTGFKDSEDSAIWLDQLDYMPRLHEDKKVLTIEVELVLESEPLERSDDE